MADVICYIDGFNVYHSIVESAPTCKWVDYWRLANSYLLPGETLKEVRYYTAVVDWDPGKANRHGKFIKVLRDTGVKVIEGRFKEVDRHLVHSCNSLKVKATYKSHEEKHTDVNIGVDLACHALLDEYDIALLVTGDTDLIPAVDAVKRLVPHKKIHLVLPPYRKAKGLMRFADQCFRLRERTFASSQLASPYTCQDGSIVHKPSTW